MYEDNLKLFVLLSNAIAILFIKNNILLIYFIFYVKKNYTNKDNIKSDNLILVEKKKS